VGSKADARGLGADVEIVVVARFVVECAHAQRTDWDASRSRRRYHADRRLLSMRESPSRVRRRIVLPPGDFLRTEEAPIFVAGVQFGTGAIWATCEGARCCKELVAKERASLAWARPGHGLAYERKRLMAVVRGHGDLMTLPLARRPCRWPFEHRGSPTVRLS